MLCLFDGDLGVAAVERCGDGVVIVVLKVESPTLASGDACSLGGPHVCLCIVNLDALCVDFEGRLRSVVLGAVVCKSIDDGEGSLGGKGTKVQAE